jgi:hypothetical protein
MPARRHRPPLDRPFSRPAVTALAPFNRELNRLLQASPSAANLQQNIAYGLKSDCSDEGSITAAIVAALPGVIMPLAGAEAPAFAAAAMSTGLQPTGLAPGSVLDRRCSSNAAADPGAGGIARPAFFRTATRAPAPAVLV